MAYSTSRRTLTSLLCRSISRSFHSSSPCRFAFASAIVDHTIRRQLVPNLAVLIRSRYKTTGPGYSPLNDPSPNWNNRPPKETILLDGCDYEHWLIVMEFPTNPKPSDEEMINSYVKTLAEVVGSEEEAKKKIYSVSTTTYTGFGALISEELSYKVKGLPGVLWVLPDSYLDVPNKDYGGDLFVDGKVIRRPQYDFSDRPVNNRTRNRPRHDRRREPVQRRSYPQSQPQGWSPSQGQGQNPQQPAAVQSQNMFHPGGGNPAID